MREWIRQCLLQTPRNEQSLLVWVSFQAHLTDEVKADLNPWKIDVAVIPGGLTPVLQPPDKCFNKPFKDNVRRKYLAWMISSPFDYTLAGKKKAPSRNLVLRWVYETWREIPVEMVNKSFKTCGISNSLDGTEMMSCTMKRRTKLTMKKKTSSRQRVKVRVMASKLFIS